MNIPSLIENSPEAIKEYQQVVAELGQNADEGGYLSALYASIRVEVRHLQEEIAVEGTMLTRPSGLKYLNPKCRILAASRKQSLRVATMLGLTTKAKGGKRPASRGPSLREMLDRPAAASGQSLI